MSMHKAKCPFCGGGNIHYRGIEFGAMMADCLDCKSIINLSDENATRGEFYLKKYVELRKLVIELDSTMCGENVYLLSHKSHAAIRKIKAFLGREEVESGRT